MGFWHFSCSRPTAEAALLITKRLKWFRVSQNAALTILNVGHLLWLPSAMQVLSHIHVRRFWITLCPHVQNSVEDKSHIWLVCPPKYIHAENPLIYKKNITEGIVDVKHPAVLSLLKAGWEPLHCRGCHLDLRTLPALWRTLAQIYEGLRRGSTTCHLAPILAGERQHLSHCCYGHPPSDVRSSLPHPSNVTWWLVTPQESCRPSEPDDYLWGILAG